MSRPALPALVPGDTVYVMRSSNDMRGRSPSERAIEAHVVKVARVWITVETVGRWPIRRRFRLDDQHDGSEYPGSSERFLSPDQLAWEVAEHEAVRYLREQGIELSFSSPWNRRRAQLAAVIKAATDG